MKICITSIGDSLESQVDPKFGRCTYFIFVETDNMDFEVVANKHANEAGGAGIQSGQLISKYGAEVVLTGNVGPNAFQTLNAAGVKIITGVSGIVKDVINKFKNGELKPVDNATVDSHFGMKGGK